MNSLKKIYNKKRLLRVLKGSTFFCGEEIKFESLPLKKFKITSTSVKDYPYLRLQNRGVIYYSSNKELVWSDFLKKSQKDLSLVVSSNRYINPQEFSQKQSLDRSFYFFKSQSYLLGKCLDYHDKSFNKSTNTR